MVVVHVLQEGRWSAGSCDGKHRALFRQQHRHAIFGHEAVLGSGWCFLALQRQHFVPQQVEPLARQDFRLAELQRPIQRA